MQSARSRWFLGFLQLWNRSLLILRVKARNLYGRHLGFGGQLWKCSEGSNLLGFSFRFQDFVACKRSHAILFELLGSAEVCLLKYFWRLFHRPMAMALLKLCHFPVWYMRSQLSLVPDVIDVIYILEFTSNEREKFQSLRALLQFNPESSPDSMLASHHKV